MPWSGEAKKRDSAIFCPENEEDLALEGAAVVDLGPMVSPLPVATRAVLFGLAACHGAEALDLPTFQPGEQTMVVFGGADLDGTDDLRVVALGPAGPQEALGVLRRVGPPPTYQVAFFAQTLDDLDLPLGQVALDEGGAPFDFRAASRRFSVSPGDTRAVSVDELPFEVREARYRVGRQCIALEVEWSKSFDCDRPDARPDEPFDWPRFLEPLDGTTALLGTDDGCMLAVTQAGFARLTRLEAEIERVAPPDFQVQSAWRSGDGRLWLGGEDRTLIEITGDPAVAPIGRQVVHQLAVNGEQGRHQLMELDGAADGSEIYAPSLRGDLIRLTTTATPGFTTTFVTENVRPSTEGRVAWLAPGVAIVTRDDTHMMVARPDRIEETPLPLDTVASIPLRIGPDEAVLGTIGIDAASLFHYTVSTGGIRRLGGLDTKPWALVHRGSSLLYAGVGGTVAEWRATADCRYRRVNVEGDRLDWLVPLGSSLYLTADAAKANRVHLIRATD